MKLTINTLHDQINNCEKCPSLRSWEKFSSGSQGNFNAKAIILSEAPGGKSFNNGKMWSGSGGVRLRNILGEIDGKLHLEEMFYMSDVVKCHPPDNRDPNHEEIQKCSSFLMNEIALINPLVIISFGRYALDYLACHFKCLEIIPTGRITELHSNKGYITIKFKDFELIPLIHPVAANRFPQKLDYNVYKSHIICIFEKIIKMGINLA